jgi:hypothetical protein
MFLQMSNFFLDVISLHPGFKFRSETSEACAAVHWKKLVAHGKNMEHISEKLFGSYNNLYPRRRTYALRFPRALSSAGAWNVSSCPLVRLDRSASV